MSQKNKKTAGDDAGEPDGDEFKPQQPMRRSRRLQSQPRSGSERDNNIPSGSSSSGGGGGRNTRSRANSETTRETMAELAKFREDLVVVEREIETFQGPADSRELKLLKERLVATMCKLDAVEDGGEGPVRDSKRVINRAIKNTLSTLNDLVGNKGKQRLTLGGGDEGDSFFWSHEEEEEEEEDYGPPDLTPQRPIPRRLTRQTPQSVRRRGPVTPQQNRGGDWENFSAEEEDQMAVSLLYTEETELKVDEEALREVLSQPEVGDRRVAIVSVMGASSEEHFTLLNLVLGYFNIKEQKGFQLKKDSYPEITLWPKPFIFGNTAVFVMSGDGLDVLDAENAPLMFTLLSLISSVLVVDCDNTLFVDSSILRAVKFMQELGLLLVGETGDKPLHKLVVAMQPNPSEMGTVEALNPQTYGLAGGLRLLQSLIKGSYGDQVQQFVQRLLYMAAICYEQFESFLLPLSYNTKGRDAADVPLFVRLGGELVERLLHPERLPTLRVAGCEMRAHELPALLSTLLSQLQQPDITPHKLLKEIAGVEHKRAQLLALENYDKEVKARLPDMHSEHEIQNMHDKASQAAMKYFDDTATFRSTSNTATRVEHREYLKKSLKSRMEVLRPIMAQREEERKKREKERKERVKEELEVACADHQRALSETKCWDVARPLQAIHEEITSRVRAEFSKNVGHLLQEEDEKTKYTAKLERKTRAVFMVTKRDYDPWRTEEAHKQASTLYREVLEAALGTDAFATAHTEAWERAKNRLTQLIGEEQESLDAVLALLTEDVGKLRTELQSTHEQYLQRAQDERTARAASLEQAQRQAPARYRQLMADAMPGLQTLQQFEEAHENSLEIAMAVFDELRNQVDEETYKPYPKSATQAISVQYDTLRDEYIKKSLEQEVTKCMAVYESTMDSLLLKNATTQEELQEAHELHREKLLKEMADLYEEFVGEDICSHFQEKAKKLMDDRAVMLYAALESKTLERGFLALLAEFTSAMEKLDLASCSRETLKKTYQAAREKTLQGIREKLKDKPNLESVKLREADQAMTAVLNTKTAEVEEANREGFAYEDALAAYTAQMQEVLEWGDSPPTDQEVKAIHEEADKKAQQIFKDGTKGKIYGDKLQIFSKKLTEDINLTHEKISTDFAMLVRKSRIDSRTTLRRIYDRLRGKKAEYAIGIDLGTTNSCVMVYKDDKLVPILNENKKPTTPSIVYFDQHGICVGETAKFKGFVDPANCITEVKRIIGRTYDDQVVQAQKKSMAYNIANMGGQPQIQVSQGAKRGWFPEEVSTELLKELKYQAGVQLGCEVHDAVVTIPAYFTEPQRDATLRACKAAGLNVLRLLNEPTAAAMAYGLQALGDEEEEEEEEEEGEERDEEDRTVLVFDFGGGTCDVSILKMRGGNFVVKASRGDNKLGGEDYDDRLADHFAQQLEKDNTGLELDGPARRRLRNMAEIAKCRLTDAPEYNMHLVNFVGDYDIDEVVTRRLLERLTKDLSERALIPVKDCLQDAGLRPQDIDEIVLAGGSSRIPKVQELLREYFGGKILYESINPDEAIACGAALQAALLTGECKRAIKVQDITPFSLGIKVVGEKFSIIVKMNSRIPCEATGRYYTVDDYQSAMDICVYQGEDTRDVHNNTKLGEFTLSGLKRAPAGQAKMDVTFKIDDNGILHVTAVEVGTELKNQKSVTIKKKVNL